MWDFKIDHETRDWVFAANRDYASVSGDELLAQRAMNRLMIERGSYIYDRTGTIGSRLTDLLHSGGQYVEQECEMVIRETLVAMEDVHVVSVEIGPRTDSRQVPVKLTLAPVLEEEIVSPVVEEESLAFSFYTLL